ncbi:MAG: hypothetical protein GX433_14530 [Deltaproteobacteria bacterium]|nr:hypothetical protein [Deltaproteobacteria bacterium]
MGKMSRLLLLTFILCIMAAPLASARSQEPANDGDENDTVLVGRISHVEGELMRYVPEEKDWVATVKDAPFGLNDALYSDENAKAEFIMPNGTWIRIDGDTQIQLIALQEEVTEIDVATGIARFYNKSPNSIIKVTTPFGYVAAPVGSTFDLYVGDNSVEVIPLKGTVDFIHEGDEARYDVSAGAPSLIADSRDVSSGEGTVDGDWDDWNQQRDDIWNKRIAVKGDSVRYLPEGLRDEAYELEDNGTWEKVYYDGGYHTFWRPTRVAVGWTPFSAGRWTVYYGDNCWIPDEPFGYVTHHYGNWVYAGTGWYWAPPVSRVRVVNVAPAVGIGFSWYPGRVGWIHADTHIGWVPLAPTEVYYGHRRWGPRSIVVNDINITTVNINRFRYIDRAVVVNHRDFYRVNDYRNVRITNINKTTIINNYRPAPVVNQRIINNYTSIKERYNFTNTQVTRKPHQTVIGRIERNQRIAQQATRVNARAIERDVERIRPRKVQQSGQIQPPRVSNRFVNVDSVNKPSSEVRFEQRELKRKQGLQRQGTDSQPQDLEGMRRRPARELHPGDNEQINPSTAEGRRIRPTKPGRELQQGDNEQINSSNTEGRRIRPTKPGRELQQGDNEQINSSNTEGRRIRPTKPGRELQQEDNEQINPSTAEGRRIRPTKPGRELQQGNTGSEDSSLNDLRTFKKQRDRQQATLTDELDRQNSTVQAERQNRRLERMNRQSPDSVQSFQSNQERRNQRRIQEQNGNSGNQALSDMQQRRYQRNTEEIQERKRNKQKTQQEQLDAQGNPFTSR